MGREEIERIDREGWSGRCAERPERVKLRRKGR